MKQAIIWRKSIYFSDYHCNRCGTQLFDKKKREMMNVSIQPTGNTDLVYCSCCKEIVAYIKPYSGDGEGRMGHWTGESWS